MQWFINRKEAFNVFLPSFLGVYQITISVIVLCLNTRFEKFMLLILKSHYMNFDLGLRHNFQQYLKCS